MSDETSQPPSPPTRPRMLGHTCEHPGCGKEGGWGYARGPGQTNWFCFSHRNDGEAVLNKPIFSN